MPSRAGGRYDGLISHLGGDATPAIGLAMGIERVVELLVQGQNVPAPRAADVFVVVSGEQACGPGAEDRRAAAQASCRTGASG